jgi:hypothetical protein
MGAAGFKRAHASGEVLLMTIRTVLSALLGLLPKQERLKEDNYPRDKSGKPDLSHYTEPLEYYVEMYEQFLSEFLGPRLPQEQLRLALNRRANGQWGLIAKGPAAIPYALKLLKHREPEPREDGAAILGWIGSETSTAGSLLAALATETETIARDTIIGTLGTLRSRKAIPAMATIIRDTTMDSDTRWTAMESLGEIVGQRFDNEADPIQAAITWLDNAHA